jgi:hypothetical protein
MVIFICTDSRKLLDSEINYAVYDKELLAVVDSLKQWRHLLVHSEEEIVIYSDHNLSIPSSVELLL